MTTGLAQGDLALLDTDVAQRRLHTADPLRLSYLALDGTPRVIPVLFHWDGEEIVMAGFAPSARARALRVSPAVAITIDTNEPPPEVLLLRGRAEVTEVRGLVPEYAYYMRRYLLAEAAEELFAEIERRETIMERIAVRPAWAGVMDFQTRYPAAMPDWRRS